MFKKIQIYKLIFFRLLLIVVGIELSIYFFKINLFFTGIFGFCMVFLLVREMYFYVQNMVLLYNKTISSILQNDFTSDFSKHKIDKNYGDLFQLYETMKSKHNEQISRDIIYRSILNNIETGVIILQKQEHDWSIFLMNDYFSSHFNVPKVSKWKYLKNQLSSLCEILEKDDFHEIKTSIEISINEQSRQTFVLQASRTEIFEQDYFIVLLDSIQNVVEKKEKDAWINLMKVISHELLNSITPIRSICQNLEDLVEQDSLSAEDLEDIKHSVQTMLRRSDHLQKFVEGYRKLAMLPSPKKEYITLQDLIENCVQTMNPLFKKENVEVLNAIKGKYQIYVDQQQIEQVLINLMTNSINALESINNKEIGISAEAKDNRVFIKISDNGKGIEKEIEDKIFLPFFTTRNEGAGIGLTLSKNIIEAHGGYILHNNKDGKTTFEICLIDE
ncbi:nitrogen fixation/metabolism regulation signal transduction histidine kinase [Flavobacterium nitrogenifigens]|uniref:histidine kinase n=2 Tax=Flavobacterium TaxID=237 RepID=A0A7W7N8R5_9FLAO|nr:MULTISPECIES: ATP-binding protein [Flavobacterium]MBB4802726.1 nitrogen fixation/metabolism regulation signal transduction histidine kinase [Flavobacterium nitrogenifigens]MBB6387684.1 nitrogen fixation/metabolism regulation signal transduction histidine kinase [Flavobacterium notoginsengisoli]